MSKTSPESRLPASGEVLSLICGKGYTPLSVDPVLTSMKAYMRYWMYADVYVQIRYRISCLEI